LWRSLSCLNYTVVSLRRIAALLTTALVICAGCLLTLKFLGTLSTIPNELRQARSRDVRVIWTELESFSGCILFWALGAGFRDSVSRALSEPIVGKYFLSSSSSRADGFTFSVPCGVLGCHECDAFPPRRFWIVILGSVVGVSSLNLGTAETDVFFFGLVMAHGHLEGMRNRLAALGPARLSFPQVPERDVSPAIGLSG